jgi:hypothetical protein
LFVPVALLNMTASRASVSIESLDTCRSGKGCVQHVTTNVNAPPFLVSIA